MFTSKLLLSPILAVWLTSGCEDDRTFTDAQGYYCSDWNGYLCDTAVSDYGYSFQEETDIIENCCATCGSNGAGCPDDPDFMDAQGYYCYDWAGYSCFRGSSEWDYSIEETKDILKSCSQTCGSCPYDTEGGECMDNFMFSDAYGYTCGEWFDYDCNAAVTEYGYNDQEMHYILANCGYSCNSCGYADDLDCKDSNDFVDQDGYHCDDWHGYDCDDAGDVWGYSEQGEQDVFDNCPLTCETCESGFDDNDCMDDKEFVDEDGYYCSEWYGYTCENARAKWFYSLEGELDLLRRCPKTCGTCNPQGREEEEDLEGQCKDSSSFVDDQGYGCKDWEGYFCIDAALKWFYSEAGQADIFRNCPQTCGTCGQSGCRDDPTYVDEFGYACNDWRGYICTNAVNDWEYSPEGQAEIEESCKGSCGICDDVDPNCSNDYDFLDAQGYDCSDWEGYDCNAAVSDYGYSQGEMEDILMSCKRTCKTCDMEPEEPTFLDFEGFKKLCSKNENKSDCLFYGCTFNKKKDKCQMKKESKVKCKKVKDPFTCALIGCTPPASEGKKCKGTPFEFDD